MVLRTVRNRKRVKELSEVKRGVKKYKESAHMACMTDPIIQPSLEMLPTWILPIKKAGRLQTGQVESGTFLCLFFCVVGTSWLTLEIEITIGEMRLNLIDFFLCVMGRSQRTP
jgi:hypothetical protein